MNTNASRTASTAAIWLCTMIIYVGRVCRNSWTGNEAGVCWAIVAATIAFAAGGATTAVWCGGDNGGDKKAEKAIAGRRETEGAGVETPVVRAE